MKNRQTDQRRLKLERLEKRELLTTFYVDGEAPSGGDGTLGSPFQTIQAAANAANAGDTVEIRAGVYREQVDVPRSGTAADPITFRAYQGEEVVISGGDLVSGWTVHGTDLYKAPVDWDTNNNRENNTVFVNGQLSLEGKQFADNDILDIDDWGQLEFGKVSQGATTIVLEELAGTPAAHWVGAKVRYHTTDYSFETKTITAFNQATGQVTLDSPIGFVSQKQVNGFYIYDTPWALDKPGEWHKDTREGVDLLYYKTEPGQDPNTLEIEFKRRGYGFDVKSRDHIHIEGITFRGVSIDADGSTDWNVYRDNVFFAYGKGVSTGYDRFLITGTNNTLVGNEFHSTFGSAVTLGGSRNSVVNNYFHDLVLGGLGGVIVSGGVEQLVSYNTVRNFGRSFTDGYAIKSEYAYNVFENGGLLSWDTGVFDSDGGNGNNSLSLFHHNVFRNTDARGFMATFYGRNNNAVIYRNIIYDWQSGPTTSVFSIIGSNFRQAYHNTIINIVPAGAEPGESTPDALINTRYNNNLQISDVNVLALGADNRGNHNYSPSDFVNLGGRDLRLSSTSGAIDAGIVLPGINDGSNGSQAFYGAAPDAGALEFGQSMWRVGHDFTNPPGPTSPSSTYSWFAVPGMNLVDNSSYTQGLQGWDVVAGVPRYADFNSWNLKHAVPRHVSSLTGSFRTRSVELEPGEAISRTIAGLSPNTTYTLGAAVRIIQQAVVDPDQYDASSGTVSTGVYREERFVTGLSGNEWVRYDDIDFGEAGQFDQIEIIQSRKDATSSASGAVVEIRSGSPTGPVLATLDNPIDNWGWTTQRQDLAQIAGLNSIYLSVTGTNAANLAIGEIRLSKKEVPANEQTTVSIASAGLAAQATKIGGSRWSNYESFVFRTGPNATNATVTFRNEGRTDSYLDRLYVVEGDLVTPRINGDLATLYGEATQSSTAPGHSADLAVDLSDSSFSQTLDQPDSWHQIAFPAVFIPGQIEITNLTDSSAANLSNFTVSVWNGDPDLGGVPVWQKAYFGSGSVAAGGTLTIPGSELADGSRTRLASVLGTHVRIQLNGNNNNGNGVLSIADLTISDARNVQPADNLAVGGTADQSSYLNTDARYPDAAMDGDHGVFTHTRLAPNQWWQVELRETGRVDQLVVFNSGRNGPFRVTAWSSDPKNGGTPFWTRDYNIGSDQKLVIEGSTTSNGSRLDAFDNVSHIRLARLNSGRVVFREVQVWEDRPSNEVLVDLDAIQYRYDFGTTTSPVDSESVLVVPESTGDVSISSGAEAVDRGPDAGDEASRDFIRGSQPATFNHSIANGRYRVTLGMSDPDVSLDNQFVSGEGVLLASNIDRPAGSSEPVVIEVDVTDGQLNLVFGDSDTSSRQWVVNRAEIARIPSSAPSYSPDGGIISSGAEVAVNNPDTLGLVYYTTDGSDPRLADGEVSPSAQAAPGEGLPATLTVISNTTLTTRTKIGDNWSPARQQVFLTGQPLAGDYNLDGVVNAADYTVWRDNVGRSVAAYTYADGNGDGIVNEDDRGVWTSNYGNTLSETVLIDSTVGNGSFEDWGVANSGNLRVIANGAITIPGWSAQTVNNAGWIDSTSPAATDGSASDGSRNAIAAGNATLTLSSEPLSSYNTSAGDIFTIAFDAGSKDGVANAYEVYLVFAGQDRLLASFSEDAQVTSAGMNAHQYSYTASGADIGTAPTVRFVVTVDSIFSQAFVDNVQLTVEGISSPSFSLARAAESRQASAVDSDAEPRESIADSPITAGYYSNGFNVAFSLPSVLVPRYHSRALEEPHSPEDLEVRSAVFERWLMLANQTAGPADESLPDSVGSVRLSSGENDYHPLSRSAKPDQISVLREAFASHWSSDLNDSL